MSILLLWAAALASTPAEPPTPARNQNQSGYLTAGRLVEQCSSNVPAAISACYAYIAAVHDTMLAYEVWLNQREFCVPSSATQSDLRLAFLGYMSAYPRYRTGQAASAVVVALKGAYPCNANTSVKARP